MPPSEIKAEEYIRASAEAVGTPEDLHGRLTKDARTRLETAIAEIVAAEAPIEVEALIRKVGKRFGYKRVPRNRRRKILYRIPNGLLVSEGDRSFVWQDGSSPATWRGYRTSEGKRTVPEIPTAELSNAIVAATRDAVGGLTHEEAFRNAIALFGLSRLTTVAII